MEDLGADRPGEGSCIYVGVNSWLGRRMQATGDSSEHGARSPRVGVKPRWASIEEGWTGPLATWQRRHTRTLGETAASSARFHAWSHAAGHGSRVSGLMLTATTAGPPATRRRIGCHKEGQVGAGASADEGLTTVDLHGDLHGDMEDVGRGEVWSQTKTY
jgi:hypothetical protein